MNIHLHHQSWFAAVVYVSVAYVHPHRFTAYFGLRCLAGNGLSHTQTFAFLQFDQIVSSTLASCPCYCISSLEVKWLLEKVTNI